MKRIVILENNGGRLANQLWQFVSIYAYCLEMDYKCENYSFFRYNYYFNFSINNKIVNLLFFKLYNQKKNIKFFKLIYRFYVKIIKILFPRKIVSDCKSSFSLPPSPNSVQQQRNILDLISRGGISTWYFSGWLFFNSAGLKKYHQKIVDLFRPKKEFNTQIVSFVKNLRSYNKKLVGVHIRQGDFKIWMEGIYYFSQREIKFFLDEFLSSQNEFSRENTIFVLCSDGNIDKQIFCDFETIKGLGLEIVDLFTLSCMDLIIGSPASSYCAWASYYGNVPMIEFSKDKIDWSARKIKLSQ